MYHKSNQKANLPCWRPWSFLVFSTTGSNMKYSAFIQMNEQILSNALLGKMAKIFIGSVALTPLYVDIHKREVHGTPIFQYGSFIGIGAPAQNQSVWPSLTQNELSFAASTFCFNSNLTNCSTSTGGDFDPAQSITWKQDGNETTTIANSSGTYLAGHDLVHMYTHYFQTDGAWSTNVSDTPVRIAQSGNKSPGVVGMGSTSSTLKKLVDTNIIGANTYSLYIGTGFDRAGGVINGSNTFGGYDAGRFKKPVHTYSMDTSQPDYLPVTVSDIIIDDSSDPTRQRLSIVNDGPFQARISTDQYPMRLPYDVTHRFMAAMSAVPANNSDNSLTLTRPFNGTMTIQLSDGFNVTFPTSMIYNISGLSPIEYMPQDYAGPYYLSTSFLTQVYLMLDFDANKFHLAPIIQEARYIMPRTFCPNSIPVPHDYSVSASNFQKYGLVGAVVGGTVGGLAIAAAIWAFILTHRRRRAVQEQQRRWQEEEMAAKRKMEGMEMRRLSPMLPPVQIPSAYKPVLQIGERERAVSPMSEGSSRSSMSSNGKPASLRRFDTQ
ncbi:acid protease [Microthyrium microscopicum]|uniref:Acid protease n=1 Tax=Microthyrium microscopicum TaxID=703497 RepID=A0A6A6UPZ8_9PEZI|nr:acid protease [Microthyrium microscopicum]